MGISPSCEKKIENNKLMNYMIPIDVLRSDTINNPYDMFNYVMKYFDMKDKDLSKCEKEMKKFLAISLYSGPNTRMSEEDIKARGTEFRKDLNERINRHPEYKNGLSINNILRLEQFNNNYYRHHRRCYCGKPFLNTTNIIIILLIIATVILYMYRDKIFKH